MYTDPIHYILWHFMNHLNAVWSKSTVCRTVKLCLNPPQDFCDMVIGGCLSVWYFFFITFQNQQNNKHFNFSSIWPGVQRWWKCPDLKSSFKLSRLFFRKLCMPPFMCTIKCSTINALQEKLSKSVCHYPYLSDSSISPVSMMTGFLHRFWVCWFFCSAYFSHFIVPDGKPVLQWEAQNNPPPKKKTQAKKTQKFKSKRLKNVFWM